MLSDHGRQLQNNHMTKTGRNEPCWCGSGKKYKKCHLGRENEPPHSFARLFAEMKLKTRHKQCLHPEASYQECSTRIIDAHTIQKSGPLKRIVDDTSHVLTFSRDSNGHFKTEKIGWQKASTFKGFCSKHDKQMFSCIEDEPFIGTLEQCFIGLGHRSGQELAKRGGRW
jgi:hypothetical protein